MTLLTADSELKARHRTMWATGDYATMVDTFLLPVGQRLVDACGIDGQTRVLDVAAGTGNASIKREVLGLIALGMSNARIGQTLVISEKTAGHHVSRILMKLGVHNRAEAAAHAVRAEDHR